MSRAGFSWFIIAVVLSVGPALVGNALAVPPQFASSQSTASAVRSDGSLWAWGANYTGQIGNGEKSYSDFYFTPQRVGSDSNWKAVSLSNARTLAIREDGSLWGWGTNSWCNLGVFEPLNDYLAPTRIGEDTNWAAVMSAWAWSLGLKSDGTMWTWGSVPWDLGGSNCEPTQVGSDSDWVEIAGHSDFALARKADGSIWSWGKNGFGKLGLGDQAERQAPTRIGSDNDWTAVFAGPSTSGALKADGLYTWGYQPYSSDGGGGESWPSPVRISSRGDWVAGATGTVTIAIREDGSLWQSRGGVVVRIGSESDWAGVAANERQYFAVNENGREYAWGWNDRGQLGIGDSSFRSSPTRVQTPLLWEQVSLGEGYSLALAVAGTLWRWGDAWYGWTSVGTEREEDTLPVQIGSASDWSTVDAGRHHAVALKEDGSLWSWGKNRHGSLGRNQPDNKFAPLPGRIGSDSDWAAAAAGYFHSLAVKEDGTLWGWGSNGSGQLGMEVEPGVVYPEPVRIGPDSDWVSVSAGFAISGAAKEDGSLWIWGKYGPLIDDMYTAPTLVSGTGGYLRIEVGDPFSSPAWILIPGNGSIRDASVGLEYVMRILANGSLWGWGNNDRGQVGTDSCVDCPWMQIGVDTDWKLVVANPYDDSTRPPSHTLAIKEDGTLWSWGSNAASQLGIGMQGLPQEPQPILFPAYPDGDWNGDGRPDILWRNLSGGDNALWYMNGGDVAGTAGLPDVQDTAWRIAGTADFDGDGGPDILWRNIDTGANYLWYMNGVSFTRGERVPAAGAAWDASAVADFTGDGKPDIFWSHSSGGMHYLWHLDGAAVTGGAPLPMDNPDWRIAGAADFDGDGGTDVLWRHVLSGRLVVWYLDGLTAKGSEDVGVVSDLAWQVGSLADFDGDGDIDVLWRNYETGVNYLWQMDGARPAGAAAIAPVADTDWCIED